MALLGFSIPRLGFHQLAQFFLAATIFTLPWRVQSLVYASSAYELGFFNEYAAYFVHLSEILLLLTLLFTGLTLATAKVIPFKIAPLKQYLWSVLLLLAASAVLITFAGNPLLALLFFWRMIEFVLLMLLVGVGLLDRFTVLKVLAVALFFSGSPRCGSVSGGR